MPDSVVNLSYSDAFNDQAEWLRAPAYNAPLSEIEVGFAQSDVDSIIGKTRDNKSIAKIVWNGDVKYWKRYVNEAYIDGLAIDGCKYRPIVLHKTIRTPEKKFVRDAFPPRWLLITRIEPEQYYDTWKNSAWIYAPHLKKRVQIKPEEPPKEFYLWYMTIAVHNGHCCQTAAKDGLACDGQYAPPSHCLDELRLIRKGIEQNGLQDVPFDAPDALTLRMRENTTNNYEEQAING